MVTMLYNIILPRYSINNKKKEVKNFANIRLNMTYKIKSASQISKEVKINLFTLQKQF